MPYLVYGPKLGFYYAIYHYPKGPYTARLKTLVPKTVPGMVFGTRVLKWAVYGPSEL